MTQALEKTIARLLQQHEQDAARTAQALADAAAQDMLLLLALTKPFLKGAAAHAVQRYLSHPSPSPKTRSPKVRVVAPTLSHRSSPNTMGESMWELLVQQLEANTPTAATDSDMEQHEKALRTVAKAFLSRRLDEMVEARQPVKK